MLFQSLIPFRPLLEGAKWKSQQDNVPSHASKSTKKGLKREKTGVLPWLSQNPDLNPHRKIVGLFIFPSVCTVLFNILEMAIMEEWNNISEYFFKK